jgi:uncharacterized membrane protein YqhA
MKRIERGFEWLLWNSRFVVVVAVIASVVTGFALIYLSTVDVVYLVAHLAPYASGSLGEEARAHLRADTITHIVEVVDGYLLALVMLIFGLGMYELFISDMDVARASQISSRILVIENLDDLKNRLAKVILMILIVRLFEHAVKMEVKTVLDLLYLSGAIALVGLALFLSHKAEAHPAEHSPDKEAPKEIEHDQTSERTRK